MHGITDHPESASGGIGALHEVLEKAHRVPEVAALLKISERQVWALIKRGDLRSIKVNNKRMVLPEDLDAYAQRVVSGAAGAA
jgi:excisionase family DNA binding protein